MPEEEYIAPEIFELARALARGLVRQQYRELRMKRRAKIEKLGEGAIRILKSTSDHFDAHET